MSDHENDISRRGFLASMLVAGGGAMLARHLPLARVGEVIRPVQPVVRPLFIHTPGMALRRITATASGHGTIGVLRNKQAIVAATFDRHMDTHLMEPLLVQPSDTMQVAFRQMDATDLVVSLTFEDHGSLGIKTLTVPGQIHGDGTFQPLFLA